MGGADRLGQQSIGRGPGPGVVALRVGDGGVVADSRPQHVEGGVDAGRVDLGAPGPLVPRLCGKGPDHGDASGSSERQHPAVGQEHRAGSGSAAGDLVVGVVRAVMLGTVAPTALHQFDDPGRTAVEVGDRKPPVGQRCGDVGVECTEARRHLDVEARADAGDAVAHRAPVAHHQAVETPLVAEDGREQLVVLGGVGAVDDVVAAHDRPRRRVLDRDLETGEVDLAQRALVDDGVDDESVRLLVVDGEVLDARADAAGLDAPHHGSGELAAEKRVLRQVLEAAPATGMPFDVEARAEHDRHALRERLLANGAADRFDERRVPARAERNRRREAGRRSRTADTEVIGGVALPAEPVGTVGDHDGVESTLGQRTDPPEALSRHQSDLRGDVEAGDDLGSSRGRGRGCARGRFVGFGHVGEPSSRSSGRPFYEAAVIFRREPSAPNAMFAVVDGPVHRPAAPACRALVSQPLPPSTTGSVIGGELAPGCGGSVASCRRFRDRERSTFVS